jgi:hypothetical protein
MWEEAAGISKKALAKVSADLDTEQAKARATPKEYLDKMAAHTTHAKHSLGLDKILGEKKVELNDWDWDLELCEAVQAEAQTWGHNPWDNHDELMEFIELCRLLQDAKVGCVIKASRLVALVKHVSKVLEDLGMRPIPGIPQDLCTASDVLEVVDIILEHPKEAYDSGQGP